MRFPSRASTSSLPALAVAGLACLACVVLGAPSRKRQSYQHHNLTPDGFWHNRYHALLSMAIYGDYNVTCPNQTFTEATLLNNFPNSTSPPWTVISTFGPTPSGAQGFTAIVPEMNKALIVFQGNYDLEQTLPTESANWTEVGLPSNCEQQQSGICLVNKFAVQGYMEAKNETNDFQAIKEAYYGKGLVFSITGHGLGGMHGQIAAVDQYQENVDYYNHAYGSPRVFNTAGATYYAARFDGEAGERGVANDDQYTEFIPESENYTHSGTPFYYWGLNETSQSMNWHICWLEDSPDYSACMPTPQDNITAAESHYFYFTAVGQCGGFNTPQADLIDPFLNAVDNPANFTTSAVVNEATSYSWWSEPTSSASSTSSSSSATPTSSAAPAPTSAGAAASSTTVASGAGRTKGSLAAAVVVAGVLGLAAAL